MRTCIAVVDATRARLFTFERTVEPGGTHEALVEQTDLVNPARHRRPSELFSDSGSSSGHSGGLQYGFDDHRDAHVDNLDAQFAKAVLAEIDKMSGSDPVILCASPRMLGELRAAGADAAEELARDLVKRTPAQLRDDLAAYGLLPPRPARA